jgi:hypothetical protein
MAPEGRRRTAIRAVATVILLMTPERLTRAEVRE